jgi:hypothetical protein
MFIAFRRVSRHTTGAEHLIHARLREVFVRDSSRTSIARSATARKERVGDAYAIPGDPYAVPAHRSHAPTVVVSAAPRQAVKSSFDAADALEAAIAADRRDRELTLVLSGQPSLFGGAA